MIVWKLALSVWLIGLAVVDWQKQKVPYWATAYPFLAAAGWRSSEGAWILGALLALVLITSEWPQLWPLGIAGGLLSFAWAIPQGVAATAAVWIGAVSLWLSGLVGGADAKMAMTLSALFPDKPLPLLILSSWVVFGVTHRIVRHKGRTFQVLISSLKALPHYLIQKVIGGSNSDTESSLHSVHYPLLPAFSLAGLVCLWLI